MRSTFMGLETNKRGLYTQQTALYTTGHNVSNANTDGYSRQRVNMTPTLGYPGAGLNTPRMGGHIGTGVQAESVQRIRDEFIDRQYRQETAKLGYWESRAKAISQMEDILAEPSEYGIDEAFRLFWSSLQIVSTNPEDASARKVAIQRAEHIADSFNFINTQLKQIQGNLGNEIDVSTSQVNSLLRQIADINQQIIKIEPNGYLPNDLYDARDKLIDELNEYLPVSITREKSGGNALEIAEGSYTISYVTSSGEEIVLVKGKDYVQFTAMGASENGGAVTEGPVSSSEPFKYFTHFAINKQIDKQTGAVSGIPFNIVYDDLQPTRGKLISLIDSYGYVDIDATSVGSLTPPLEVKGYYTNMLSELDRLSKAFVHAFNKVHQAGYPIDYTGLPDLNSDGAVDQLDFAEFKVFDFDASGKMIVSDILLKNPSLLAASSSPNEVGNGKWAIELANLQSIPISDSGFDITVDGVVIPFTNLFDPTVPTNPKSLDGATFQSFYKGLIGQMGVDGEEAELLRYNTETIKLTVENNRASMSSVSLDEEMTDMIKFQQAYNANARMITVIDETLDKIINGMGRVGL